MIDWTWYVGKAAEVWHIPISIVLLYSVLIITQRLVGLRSYSKMSGTEFAGTVALGSVLGASVAAPQPSVIAGAVALAGILVLMVGAAWLKRTFPMAQRLTENNPLLLMDGPNVLHRNLARAQVTLDELHGKLRENNVWSYEQVVAVVYERTGDMAVMARGKDDLEPEMRVFADVRNEDGRRMGE